ncbi:hypothetical protein [Nonomuraea cavernae]|uniref:Uncharacterized protein n=1 Tax=Nonomuraea cavernae TaxID=2045107 RepID=A0A918DMN5_9ACTN|nr:hypothetical protein [Nonomuraea cavernae]MCA2188385.1 hypothetical protein [Nonomuraea cavernae]GGO73481.1 hypothetical protein GCM10012289_43980 [Nonomuraea cavernae]
MHLPMGSVSRLSRVLRLSLAVAVVSLGGVMVSSAPAAAVSHSTIVSVAQGQLNNAARNHESPPTPTTATATATTSKPSPPSATVR